MLSFQKQLERNDKLLGRTFFLSYLIFFLFGILIPIIIFSEIIDPHINLASVGALTIIILSAFRLSSIAFNEKITPLDMTFWIFVSFWFGFAALFQTISNNFFWNGYYSPWLQARGIFIILLGIAMYELGRHKSINAGINLFSVQLSITPRRVQILSVIASLLSIFAVIQLGGLSNIMITRMEYRNLLFESGDISKAQALMLIVCLRIPSFAALFTAWFLWMKRDILLIDSKQRALHVLTILFLIVLNFITNYPLGLPRYWLGTIILSIAFITIQHTKRIMAFWIIAFIFILLIAFPLAFQFRSMASVDSFSGKDINNITERFSHGDYDAYQQLLNTIKVIDNEGICYGENFLGAIFFWAPRSVWKSKPWGSGQIIAEKSGYYFTNLSSPLWAEAYYAFWYFGIIVVFFAYGYISGFLDRKYHQSENFESFIYIFVPFWMGFQLFFLRGDLMNGIAYSLPIIVIFLLTFKKRIIKKI